MKKKIAILGSTGSIGENTVKIIQNNKKDFNVIFLSTNNNIQKLFKQSIKLKPKAVIIFNKEKYNKFKYKFSKRKIKVFNSFYDLKSSIIKKKIDYIMCAISGLAGLDSTINSISSTKNIAIANKESIICAWRLIEKKLAKNKTKFIPVDSEHFSMWYGLQSLATQNIEKLFITASGGPLYNLSLNNFKNIKISQALKHPNWKMGKKISIDSATMINKVYEVIEAKNIFNIPYKKISILIHPKSYIHAVMKFDNGLIKIIAHDTTMKIPIFNTLFFNQNKKLKSKKIDIKTLNNLSFCDVNLKRYPMVKLLNFLSNKTSLYETVIVSANDTLVELFLKKKITFTDIQNKLFKIIKLKEFLKYKKIYPKTIKDIIELNNYVRLNIQKKVYKL